ncbi:MAG TPA: hypothetical protein VEL74_20010 [Thermoanaerobaculia bacterium]|nr:hypothetical protein [Thermoanaerobaculia bacterium]
MPEVTTKELSERLGVDRAELHKLCREYGPCLEVRYGPRGTYLWSESAVEVVRGLFAPGNPRLKIERTKEVESYEGALQELRRHIIESRRLTQSLEWVYSHLAAHPPAVTGFLYTLPHPDFRLASPLGALIVPSGARKFRATLVDLDLSAEGRTQIEALGGLRKELLMAYLRHARQPESDPERWRVFQRLVVAGPQRTAPVPTGKAD